MLLSSSFPLVCFSFRPGDIKLKKGRRYAIVRVFAASVAIQLADPHQTSGGASMIKRYRRQPDQCWHRLPCSAAAVLGDGDGPRMGPPAIAVNEAKVHSPRTIRRIFAKSEELPGEFTAVSFRPSNSLKSAVSVAGTSFLPLRLFQGAKAFFKDLEQS